MDDRGRGIEVVGAVKRFGATDVLRSVDLDVAEHETVALLGPSGCGKTTLLRSIAGLERLDGGSVTIGGTTVCGPGVHMAPEQRRVGMVFQDWALFPHMTVGENIEYGLSREERRGTRVSETLELVGLARLHGRLPSTLSGGQQQRVALARALAPRPRAILLDEPFSNLDTTLRVQVRTEVHRLLGELGITTVFVTHDQEEAFVLGDRVAVMHDGSIEQHDTPDQIYVSPSSRWVADFVGEANLVPATARGEAAESALGLLTLREPRTGPVEVLVRPEQIELSEAADDAHPGSGVGTVDLVEYYGHDHVSIVQLTDGTSVRSRASGPPRFGRGQRVAVRAATSPMPSFADG